MIKLKVKIDDEEKYIEIGIFSFMKIQIIVSIIMYAIILVGAFIIGVLSVL